MLTRFNGLLLHVMARLGNLRISLAYIVSCGGVVELGGLGLSSAGLGGGWQAE